MREMIQMLLRNYAASFGPPTQIIRSNGHTYEGRVNADVIVRSCWTRQVDRMFDAKNILGHSTNQDKSPGSDNVMNEEAKFWVRFDIQKWMHCTGTFGATRVIMELKAQCT